MTIQIGWRGEVVDVKGNLPTVGEKAPDFTLTANDLSEIELSDFAGQNLVLNIFPSIDTPTCATSTRRFNEELANLSDTAVLCVFALRSKKVLWIRGSRAGKNRLDFSVNLFRRLWGDRFDRNSPRPDR